ncbi:MAG: YggT family protein [SAR202 cluster bacterium]|nr:YggT family protein [SAR202 cluster bacterium]
MGLYLANFLNMLATVLYFSILARVLVSWFNVSPGNPFFPVIRLIYAVTEPIMGPIRKVLPKTGMFDFSPVVALILLHFIRVIARNLI